MPVDYQDFCLKIEPPRDGVYPVTVLESPAGGGHGSFVLPFEPGQIRQLRQGAYRSVAVGTGETPLAEMTESPSADGPPAAERTREIYRTVASRGDLASLGSLMFQAVFQGPLYGLLQRSLGHVEKDTERGLRIRILFDLEDPAIAEVAALPWEILYWQERREFLSLSRKTPLVRSLLVPRPVRPLLEPPLRVLLVASNIPEHPLDLEEEIHALKSIKGIDFQCLEPPTPEALLDRLQAEDFHVLHFLGHGQFDPKTGQGVLLFQDECGMSLPFPGSTLADVLRISPSLRLVFLNACRTAQSGAGEQRDPFLGVAAALAMAGLPAVLAMQLPISDPAAIRFSQKVYESLAINAPIDHAVSSGRLVLRAHANDSVEWATPVLFLRSSESRLYDAAAGPSGAGSGGLRPHILDRSALIAKKTQDFVGRGWIFQEIEAFARTYPQGYFFLSGDPGIGKTAVVAQLVKRTGAAHHFNIRASGLNSSRHFLESICAQLISTYRLGSSLPGEAGQDGRFLDAVLRKVSEQLRPGEKAMLLVDALDEADPAGLPPGVNPLFLPVLLPPSVYVIVTRRREGPFVRFDGDQKTFPIHHDSRENRADVREYIGRKLLLPGIRAYLRLQSLEESAFLEELVDKSQGNFMYLHHVLPAIARGFYNDQGFAKIPEGLQGYYDDHWRRMQTLNGQDWSDCHWSVLAALTVVDKPIPLGWIAKFSGVGDRRKVREILGQWRDFIHSDGEAAEGERFRIYHESFREFIACKDEVIEEHRKLKTFSARIADLLWQRFYGNR